MSKTDKRQRASAARRLDRDEAGWFWRLTGL